MRKDRKMEVHVTKNGYRYYTPQKAQASIPQSLQERKWKRGIRWLGDTLLTGLKNLPSILMRAAVLMITTPLMLLVFILNLIKGLIGAAIAWFLFKVVVGFVVICYYAFLTKAGSAPAGVETWFHNWIMPEGVPIHHWWETTIIVVLAVLTALSMTFYPDEDV